VAVAARGRFIVAVSGGHTPWQMLRALANENVPWEPLGMVERSAAQRQGHQERAAARL
jgi:6-phosphogluconolactonase/glucosamine-6-phosphate isomerase/deaminase